MSLLSHFFSIMIPPPPTSTLFPYTTLFRSKWRYGALKKLATSWPFHACRYRTCRWDVTRVPVCPDAKDRKSTRLNSSHLGISYAVFCLKKKKNKKHHKCNKQESNTMKLQVT